MLDGLSELFGDVLEVIYDPASLIKVEKAYSTDGDITEAEAAHDVFLHPVSRTEAYRQSAGLADDEIEIIVLASHIPGVTIDTDDRLVADSDQWSVVRAKLDGPKSQWKCICKERKNG